MVAARRTRATSSPPSRREARRRARAAAGAPVAWLRMCSSSPICSPCAARARTSTGPSRSSSRASSGPARSRRKRRPLDRLVVADAEPQRVARPLVERRERARARRPRPRRPRPASTASRRRSSAPTWPCSLPLRSATSPAAEQRRGASAVRRPALEQARRDQRAPLRVADALPLDRRPGVQQHAVREAVDHLAGRRDRDAPAAARPRSARPPPRWPPRRARRGGPRAARAGRRSAASPPAGGRQSTSSASAPCSRSAAPNDVSPTLTAAVRAVRPVASHSPSRARSR